MTRNEIYEILQKHVADVAFTKVDGSERVMRCTLKSNLIPVPVDKPERNRTINESVLPVWDIDKNAWRSFRVDSVSSVQTVML